MAGRSRITVEKLNGGLGRRAPSKDMVSALVINGVATANLTLGKVYELKSVEDAKGLLITESYDTSNSVLVYHHISRVFLRNPSAILHIMLVSQSVTLTQMVTKENDFLAKLLREKAGTIVQWAVARNPTSTYRATLTNGLDADVITAIAKAQELIDFEETKFRYSDGFIEGRSFNGTATAAVDLRTKSASGVSVVIAADPAISNLKAIYNGYAAVGDVLGLTSLADVSQNIGEFASEFNLTNETNKTFMTAGLSSNRNISEYSDVSLDTLHDKGYIFADSVSGEVGFWLNDSSTCVVITDDYAYKEGNRTIKKAIKSVRKALLPRIKRRIAVNPATGRIARTDAKDMETTLKAALKTMQDDGDISGGIDGYVDPEQNILSTSVLEVQLTFVPIAIGRQITLKIGFNNPLK